MIIDLDKQDKIILVRFIGHRKNVYDQIFRRASLADARDPAQCAGYEGSFGKFS